MVVMELPGVCRLDVGGSRWQALAPPTPPRLAAPLARLPQATVPELQSFLEPLDLAPPRPRRESLATLRKVEEVVEESCCGSFHPERLEGHSVAVSGASSETIGWFNLDADSDCEESSTRPGSSAGVRAARSPSGARGGCWPERTWGAGPPAGPAGPLACSTRESAATMRVAGACLPLTAQRVVWVTSPVQSAEGGLDGRHGARCSMPSRLVPQHVLMQVTWHG